MQILISKKSVFFLGIFVFLIPFMGIPTLWKTVLVSFSGIFLILSSVSFTLPVPKKIVKAKVRRTTRNSTPKGEIDDIVLENLSSRNSRENIIE